MAITAQQGQNLGLRNDQRTQTWVNITGNHTGKTETLAQRHPMNQSSCHERNNQTKRVRHNSGSVMGKPSSDQ